MAKVDRLETLVQREVANIISHVVKDDLGFFTVTDVKITNELSYMYVYYTVFGGNDALEKTKEALERAKGFIKNQIALKVKMRKVPELIFRHDESYEKGKKVDDLIRKIK
ncbi:MAG: 30S ribosome-binding factor RbfA [Firmicutes bacterium]|nr:30S ribosome-binding factor RbfA [Bacillota bacterium]